MRWILCVDEMRDLDAALRELDGALSDDSMRLAANRLSIILLNSGRKPGPACSMLFQTLQGLPAELSVRSVPAIAARRLLRARPLHLSADDLFGQRVHALIVGSSDLAIAIALEVLKLAHDGAGRPKITFASLEPAKTREQFLMDFPGAFQFAELQFIGMDLSDLETHTPVSAVYLCDSDSSKIKARIQRIVAAMHELQRVGAPIFAEVEEYQSSGEVSAWDGWTHPFSVLSNIGDCGVLFGEREDELARIVHDYYQDSILAQGRSLTGNPAALEWAKLDDAYREANRHQADHMAAKLASIDCRAVTERESEFFVFDTSEVERLARIEHDRWSADRYLNGWTHGTVRDNIRKIHPQLLSYDELSEEMKDLDRYTVRLMPALLARHGLAIRRDLIVAVGPSRMGLQTHRIPLRALDTLFERLTRRHPDRGLVLAIDPADRIHRRLAQRAREQHRAVLWALATQRLEPMLSAGPARDRCETLEILAFSERRIAVPADHELARWIAQRAHIVCLLTDPDRMDSNRAGLEFAQADRSEARTRWVYFNPESGATRWSFEY